MPRKITIELIFDDEQWSAYHDVCDEIILDDAGVYEALEKGVEVRIISSRNTN